MTVGPYEPRGTFPPESSGALDEGRALALWTVGLIPCPLMLVVGWLYEWDAIGVLVAVGLGVSPLVLGATIVYRSRHWTLAQKWASLFVPVLFGAGLGIPIYAAHRVYANYEAEIWSPSTAAIVVFWIGYASLFVIPIALCIYLSLVAHKIARTEMP